MAMCFCIKQPYDFFDCDPFLKILCCKGMQCLDEIWIPGVDGMVCWRGKL